MVTWLIEPGEMPCQNLRVRTGENMIDQSATLSECGKQLRAIGSENGLDRAEMFEQGGERVRAHTRDMVQGQPATQRMRSQDLASLIPAAWPARGCGELRCDHVVVDVDRPGSIDHQAVTQLLEATKYHHQAGLFRR